jgi:hypothetical protein
MGKRLSAFVGISFTSKKVKTLMGMGLSFFYPFDVFSLPSMVFNPIYHENSSKSRQENISESKTSCTIFLG